METAAWKSNKNLLKSHFQFANQPRSRGSLLPVPMEREREPGWVWSHGSRTKLILREKSFASQFCVLFTTQWSQGLQEQDRFANPTTITESMGNFCLKLIILPEEKARTHVVAV